MPLLEVVRLIQYESTSDRAEHAGDDYGESNDAEQVFLTLKIRCFDHLLSSCMSRRLRPNADLATGTQGSAGNGDLPQDPTPLTPDPSQGS